MLLYEERKELEELEKIASLDNDYWQHYIGLRVKHKAFGEGSIVGTFIGKIDGAIMLLIKFDNVKKRRAFPLITLKKGKLTGDDSTKRLIARYERAKKARYKIFEIIKEKKIEFKEEDGTIKARYYHRPGDGIVVSGGLPGFGKKR